jgi:hypothetical protein
MGVVQNIFTVETVQGIFVVLNFVAFVVSVFVLWKSARAVEGQAEGTSKPVLTLMRRHSEPSDMDFLEPQIHVDVLVPFKVRNVGTGPALMVRWRFVRDSGQEIVKGFIPYIRTNQWVNLHLNQNQLGFSGGGVFRTTLECGYRSASHLQYRSETRLENLKIVDFKIERVSR